MSTQQDKSKASVIGVRVLKGVLRTLLGLLLAIFCLVTSVLIHLNSNPAREVICSLGRDLGNDAIAGSMDFQCVDIDVRLMSVTAELASIELTDAEGVHVVDVERASASAAIFPLIGGELLLSDVVVQSPRISLSTDAEGGLRISQAFLPAEPSPPDPAPSTFVMRVTGAVSDASVHDVPGIDVQVSDLDLDLRIEVEGESVEIHGTQNGNPRDAEAAVQERESASIVLNGQPYVALSGLTYDAALRDGGSMDASLRLATEDGHLDVSASLPWVNDTLGALDARVEGVLTNAMLTPFTGQDLLGGPTEIGLDVRSAESDAPTEEYSPFDALNFEGSLRPPGGELALDGSVDLSGPLQANLALRTPGLNLAEALAADLGVAGAVQFDLNVSAAESASGWDIQVRGEDIAYDTWEVERLIADATITEDAVVLSRLDLPALSEGGHMDIRGRYGFDGDLSLNVDADLPRLSAQPSLAMLLPGVGGRARIEAEVSLRDDVLDARADVNVRGFRMQDVRVAEATVRASASGPVSAPRLDAHVRTGQATLYGIDLTRVDLSAAGDGPYRIRGRVEGPAQFVDRALVVDVDTQLGIEDGVQATGNVRARGLFPQPVTIDIQRFALGENSFSVGALAVRAPNVLGATMRGRVSFRGRSDFSFDVDHANLEPLGDLLEVPIEGTVAATGEFHGSIARPALHSEGSLTSVKYQGLELATLQWHANVNQNEGKAELELLVEALGEVVGRVEIKLMGTAPSADLSGDWQRAPLDLHVQLSGTKLEPLRESLNVILGPESLPALSGTLGVELHSSGSYIDPRAFELFLAVNDFGYPDLELMVPRVEFQSELDDGNLLGSLVLKEASAPMLDVRVALTFDRMAWEQNARQILQHPWSVDLLIPERSLRDFPIAMLEEQEGRVGLNAHFQGQGQNSSLGGAEGTVSAVVSYPPVAGEHDGDSCSISATRMTLEGRLNDGTFNLDSRVRTGGAERATLSATMPLPLDSWVVQMPERLPAINADLSIQELPMNGIPIVCAEVAGEVNLEAQLQDILGDQPMVDLRGTIAGLQSTSARDHTPPADFNIEAHATASRATVSLRLAGETELFVAEGSVPMAMDDELHLPLPDTAGWQGRANFNHAPLAILAAPVALIGSPRGHLSGEVSARGDDAGQVHVRGGVELEEVGFTLREPLLRVESLNGRVALDDDRLHLHDVRFRDRDGTILVNGHVGMDGWELGRVDATAVLDDFPFRLEGIVYATLDTKIDITGEFGDPVSEFDVGLRDAAIQISPDVGRQVQSLSQHPDVVYEDDDGFSGLAGTLTVSNEADEADDSETRINLTSNPFYVRRDDFSVQVEPDLIAIIDSSGVRLEGTVDIRRGFLSIVGKQFEFERSEIRFSGGRSINPRLDITAVHELANQQTVTVQLSGDLFSLELNFSSSDPSAETEAEILALLIGGGGGGNDSAGARDQVLGFVSGLTAGLLSSLTRRELGEYIPVFGIESNATGARLRAAIQADRLIPDFLSDVVIGAHIEGYVGGQSNEGAGGSFAGGVELELLFPYSLLLNTRYQQGNTWGLELRWEP